MNATSYKSSPPVGTVSSYAQNNNKPIQSKEFKRQQFLKRSDSKSPLSNYVPNTSNATVFPDFDLNLAFRMIDEDPVANGAIAHYVDKCMEGDFAIIKADTSKYDKEFEMKLDREYKFRQEILRPLFKIGKIARNVFLEIVPDSNGNTKQLNIVDSRNIEPITKPNGDVIKFLSKIPDPNTGVAPEWSKNEMKWLKFNDQKQGYAPINLRAVYDNLLAKEYVKRYVAWLWQTGQYRILYGFESASDKDIGDFVAYLRKNDENFKAPFLLKGKMKAEVLRDMKETNDIISLLKYYDSQTLILLRVPPIDAGIPDASGRSSSDAQSNNFSTTIKSDKKAVEDFFNFEVFPAINKSNNLLVFGPTDRMEEKQVWEIVTLMKGAMMSDDFIREYLIDRGLVYAVEDMFNEQPEMGAGVEKPLNSMPSRQKSVDKNKVGTGQSASSRSDQVQKEE